VVEAETDCVLGPLCLLPATLGQWVVQAALDWCLVPLRAHLAAGTNRFRG
jgi:hypothetical protein